MSVKFTNQQQNAINATDGSVLVSAAAGSGKTAVLIERIIRLITNENNPVDVDRLLIVTFTRAAAAQMRQRLQNAINKLLQNDPYNALLLRQKQLMCNANISTIDSFCTNLVREYFTALNIKNDFRMGDTSELEILSSESLDEIFDEYYDSSDESFLRLVDAFSDKNSDTKLRNSILKISKFLDSQPFSDMWLNEILNRYDMNIPVEKSIWGQIIVNNAKTLVSHAVALCSTSLDLMKSEPKLYESLSVLINSDLEFLNSLKSKLDNSMWDEISEFIGTFKSGTLRAPKEYTKHPIKLSVASNRTEVKKVIDSIKLNFFTKSVDAQEEIKSQYQLVKKLFEVLNKYLERFNNKKSDKNILSFADVELLTVKLLSKPTQNSYEKTDLAFEISNRFDYVMVDEFQDVNDVQDLIFNCVSKDLNNLFVVGDVKQSIYGFRQAKPEIFLKRKKQYKAFDENNPEYPSTIILDKNFRSRFEVCDATNFIFQNIMTQETAGMDYTADDKLNIGASYEKSDNCNFEFDLLDVSSDDDKILVEAQFIAEKIHKMISEGFLIKDGDAQRPCTYGDFAILLRKTKEIATDYVDILNMYGIAASCETKQNAFETQEVKILLNFLRVIDNPTQNIALLSVISSPIYGFTPDELAKMRSDSRHQSLYVSLKNYAQNSDKAKKFLKELKNLQTLSFTSTVDELIETIFELTSFTAITSAVKDVSNPTANLLLLRENARAFEKNGYKSLSEFISFIEKMIANGVSLDASSNSDTSTLNKVRVMSIHNSKGLEFPICFLANTDRKFNTKELSEDVLLDSKSGLGLRKRVGICKYNTIPREAVKLESRSSSVAEEQRVLYVALTRAKEKLIVSAVQKDAEMYLSKQYSKLVLGKNVEPYSVINATSFCDWITLCALVHPSCAKIRSLATQNEAPPVTENTELCSWDTNVIKSSEISFEEQDDTEQNVDESKRLLENQERAKELLILLKKRLSFEYPDKDIMDLPQKVSASQVSHDGKDSLFDRVLLKPQFLTDKKLNSVERGTAHHKLLQMCNFTSLKEDIDKEISRLCKEGYISKSEALSIDKSRIEKFTKTELFSRIICSNDVSKEAQFAVEISPSLVSDEYINADQKAKILLQGACDLVFSENNMLVIVDYKTDRVKSIDELKNRYSKQLMLYKNAVEQTKEMKVKECIIYSTELSEYVSVC